MVMVNSRMVATDKSLSGQRCGRNRIEGEKSDLTERDVQRHDSTVYYFGPKDLL